MKRKKTVDTEVEEEASITKNSSKKESANVRKKQKKGVEEAMSKSDSQMDTTALHFFKNQQYGAKGIRKELKQYNNVDIRIDPDDYHKYITEYYQDQRKHAHFSRELSNHLLWLGLSNHNILLYGYGNLSHSLDSYAKDYLQGEDVLEIKGNPGNNQPGTAEVSSIGCLRNVKSALNAISSSVLKDPKLQLPLVHQPDQNLPAVCHLINEKLNRHFGRSSHPAKITDFPESHSIDLLKNKPKTRKSGASHPLQEWKGKWAHVQSKLYLIIYELDGPAFASPEAQECLSILASCESITMIATTASINIHLLWNQQQQYRFAWRYFCHHTFQHHPLPPDHPFIKTMSKGVLMKESTGDALIPVLISLAQKHRQFLVMIANAFFKAKATVGEEQRYIQGSMIVFPSLEAFNLAYNGLLVKVPNDLKVLLKELVDHDILTFIESPDRIQFHLTEDDFQTILLRFSNPS